MYFELQKKLILNWFEVRPTSLKLAAQVFVRSTWQLLGAWHKLLMTFSSLTEDFLKLYTFLRRRYQAVPTADCNNEQMSPF